MGLSHDETLCMRLNLQLDCRIHVIAAKPKQSGAAKEPGGTGPTSPPWLARRSRPVSWSVRGLTMADIRHELRTDTRLGFQHVWQQVVAAAGAAAAALTGIVAATERNQEVTAWDASTTA